MVDRDPHLELVDDARVGEALAERNAERLLRQRAHDTASFVGTLRDLSERATTVVVVTAAGRRHRGALLGVARDHVVLAGPVGAVHVRLDVIVTVRPQPGSGAVAAAGDRGAVDDLLLPELLARVLVDRPTVVLAFDGPGEVLRGRLETVGEDVLTVRPDGEGELVFVPARAVTEVVVER